MREPLIDEAIRLYALFGTPSKVYKELRSNFGDNSFTYNYVSKIRSTYRTEIIEKRKELTASIPLLDLEEQWMTLQTILDSALEGDIKTLPNGTIIETVDRKSALECLKLAKDYDNNKGVVISEEDDNLIKQIVTDLFEDLKKETPSKEDSEILADILESLGEKVKPQVMELKEELNARQD